MLFSVEYDVDYALMVVKQTLETENIWLMGRWTSVEQFNVVASALLQIVKLIIIQSRTTNCH